MENTLRIINVIIKLILLTAASLSAQEAKHHLSLQNKIDQYLTEGIPNGFSGAMLILKEGQIILNKGYGMADKENQIPYTPKSVAPIGSVTKQFTATAILKLVELGKLNLTDSLSLYFKHIPKDKKNITIHELLTHSSGLVDKIGEGDFDDISREKFFDALFAAELLHRPGSTYAYSNAGYSLLARIIELTTDLEYEFFLYENLFKPAGMTETGYLLPDWKGHLMAKGYAYGIISVGTMMERYKEMEKITWNLKGNGGIHSTPEDMYKWYKALKSNQIISTSSFEKLTTRHIKENENGTSFYGYGWAIYESTNHSKIISHNGGNRIYFHDFIYLPKEDVLIILFTNGASKEVEVAWKIKKMIFDPSYTPDPIKKNLHFLVIDYMKNNSLIEAKELIHKIKNEYLSSISYSHILNDLGYDLLRFESENNMEWAREIFKLNVDLFPNDGNSWDSLGESYFKNRQYDLAMECYKKALDLAPNSKCSWCKHATDAIKKLNELKAKLKR